MQSHLLPRNIQYMYQMTQGFFRDTVILNNSLQWPKPFHSDPETGEKWIVSQHQDSSSSNANQSVPTNTGIHFSF